MIIRPPNSTVLAVDVKALEGQWHFLVREGPASIQCGSTGSRARTAHQGPGEACHPARRDLGGCLRRACRDQRDRQPSGYWAEGRRCASSLCTWTACGPPLILGQPGNDRES